MHVAEIACTCYSPHRREDEAESLRGVTSRKSGAGVRLDGCRQGAAVDLSRKAH